MSAADLAFGRDYFKSEKRNPTETELKVIDTYWSDHCRHTTFATELKNVEITSENHSIGKAYHLYEDLYREINGSRPDWRNCAASHYDPSRYHLLNLHAAFSTERPAHTIEFRAFNGTLDPDKILAYIQLCLAISAQALNSKAASPTRPVTDNPKYAFRCWLLKLGFIGDEYKTAREVLIKLLPGNSAWRQVA